MAEFGNIVEKTINTILKADVDLVALVSTRIWLDHLPPEPTYPAVSYSMISDFMPMNHDKSAGPIRARIQVSSWNTSYSAARTVTELIKGALVGYTGTVSGVEVQGILYETTVPIYDPDQLTKVYHLASDFIVFITP